MRELVEETGLLSPPRVDVRVGEGRHSYERGARRIHKRASTSSFVASRSRFGERPRSTEAPRFISLPELAMLPLVNEAPRDLVARAFALLHSAAAQ